MLEIRHDGVTRHRGSWRRPRYNKVQPVQLLHFAARKIPTSTGRRRRIRHRTEPSLSQAELQTKSAKTFDRRRTKNQIADSKLDSEVQVYTYCGVRCMPYIMDLALFINAIFVIRIMRKT